MVKEQTLSMMGKSMKENTRMGNFMVKGHTLGLMDKNMKGNGRME